jgi:hypothetical protein
MKLNKPVLLEFNQEWNKIGDKKLSDGLSAVVHIGHELWVVNDESTSIERLTRLNINNDTEDAYKYGEHEQFQISDFIQLPLPSKNDEGKIEEIDIEGLDFKDGYLWLVGSHSLKRKKPDKDKPGEKKFEQLAIVSRDGNRYLLARIPLVEKEGRHTPMKETYHNGNRMTAAQLPGSSAGNDLTNALAEDIHLKDFFQLPGKDNGFDIEGLAAGNNGRIFIGLRGPVLRGYAVILELQPVTSSDNPFELMMMTINPLNPNNSSYRKHILELGGLGIRELSIDGSDMLILAGPTMDLDGPVTIFRWKNYRKEDKECFVSKDDLEEVMQIPYGKEEDHAEGMTRFSKKDGKASSLLLVYDAASKQSQKGEHTLKAEIFGLMIKISTETF